MAKLTGADVNKIRIKLGMTQAEMADELGVDLMTISRWENDKQRPSRLALRQLLRLKKRGEK